MSENNVSVKNEETGKEEKKKYSIKVKTKESFGDEGIKTEYFTSADFAYKISGLFGEVFSDYVGCKIKINRGEVEAVNHLVPKGDFYVELYFKDLEEVRTGIKAIRTRTSENGDSQSDTNMGRRLQNVIGKRSVLCYSVMTELYEVLEGFLRPLNPMGRINWDHVFSEVQERMNGFDYNRRELLVCATGIPLRSFIEEIYGKEAEDGAKYDYRIRMEKAIPHNSGINGDASYIFSVSQLNNNLIDKLNQELGHTKHTRLYQKYR